MSMFSGPGSLYMKRLALTGLGALTLVAVQPFLWNMVSSSAADLHLKRTEEEQYQNMVERLASTEEGMRANRAFYDQLSISFPALNATPQILERLEQAATRHRVDLRIRGIREQEALYDQNDIKLVPMVVTFEAEGPIERVLAYFDAVLHVPELTLVDTWTLDGSQSPVFESGTIRRGFRLSANIVFYLTNFHDE